MTNTPKERPKLEKGQKVSVARYRHGWLGGVSAEVVVPDDKMVKVLITGGDLAGHEIETERRNVR